MAILYNKMMDKLQKEGYTSYKIRQEKLLGESTLQAIREGKNPNLKLSTIDRLCGVLRCQPGDLIEYVDATDQGEK